MEDLLSNILRNRGLNNALIELIVNEFSDSNKLKKSVQENNGESLSDAEFSSSVEDQYDEYNENSFVNFFSRLEESSSKAIKKNLESSCFYLREFKVPADITARYGDRSEHQWRILISISQKTV